MKDPKKKFLQIVSDTGKTGEDITQSPSAWQEFKSDLNSVIKYPFQSLRSKMQTGNIPYNLSSAIESGNTKSQPMDTAFDMVNVPGAVLNFGQKVFSRNASTTDMVLAGASILPVGKVLKAAKNIKKAKSIVKETPYIPKELPNEGLINSEKLTSVINRSKSKGVIYDKNIGAGSDFVWKPNMFRKMPDVGGRRMVDVNPGGGIPPTRYYESTGLANKKLADGSTSKGTWVPLEGFGTNNGIKDWFIKAEGWDKGYGSSTFKNMGNLIKKYGY